MIESNFKSDALPPVRVDVAYSFINLGTTIVWSIVDGWLLYFYLPPDGQGMALVPVALYGMAVLSSRILNALFTPLIGYWSDHSRSRWGRRLPFIFVSSLPYLIFFVLLWLPPVKGESLGNLIYLAAILVVFNMAQSLLVIPFGSLLPELARADRHRVRMTAWSASFQLIGVILAGLGKKDLCSRCWSMRWRSCRCFTCLCWFCGNSRGGRSRLKSAWDSRTVSR
jgi:GPH family glycoside/pentoside/hexuronide:cation symporter